MNAESLNFQSVNELSGPGMSLEVWERRATPILNWLSEYVEVQREIVQLPKSARQFSISRPTEASKSVLFERAKAEPQATLPFWTTIWASGIALADAALTYEDELAGRRVLELGSGLGVTATAALNAGAEVVAVDYSSMALAFCRYNALTNSDQSPRTLPINWRSPDRQAMRRAGAGGRFPVIMAADVLYESRDIAPLIHLIDQLLAPGGAVWLAEPGRKVADRFLNELALDGWRSVTEIANGPWHEGTTGRVYVHYLKRPTSVDFLHSSLGGWRA